MRKNTLKLGIACISLGLLCGCNQKKQVEYTNQTNQDTVELEENTPEEIQEYRPPVNHEELIGDTTLQKLNEIFNDIMKRTVDRVDPIRSQYGNIVRDEIDVERKTIYIEEYIKSRKHFSFRELLEKQNSKLEIVVTFLVVLELMKTGKVTVVQEDLFDDIYITSQEVEV